MHPPLTTHISTIFFLCLCRGEIGRHLVWGVKPTCFYLAWLVLLYLQQIVRMCCGGTADHSRGRSTAQGLAFHWPSWVSLRRERGRDRGTGFSDQGSTWSHCPLLDTFLLLMSRRHFVHIPTSPPVSQNLLFSWNTVTKDPQPPREFGTPSSGLQYFKNIDKARNTEWKRKSCTFQRYF